MPPWQAVDKALHHVDKAVSKEHKSASKLSAVEHKHNVALQEVQKAEKDVELRKRQQADLAADLARKRASMDEYQRRKEFNDVRPIPFSFSARDRLIIPIIYSKSVNTSSRTCMRTRLRPRFRASTRARARWVPSGLQELVVARWTPPTRQVPRQAWVAAPFPVECKTARRWDSWCPHA